MTLQNCINASLQLLNQYSIMGSVIPDTYNDQKDDLLRMINLINDAVMTIATEARPIIDRYIFSVPKLPPNTPTADIATEMPANFDRATAVLFQPANGKDRRTIEASQYKWLGNDVLLVPNNIEGTYSVEYMRFPNQYTENTPLTTQIDNTPDTHNIIPYYVASMIAQYDDQKAYYNLYNIWETRLSRLGYKPPHASSESVKDEYGFANFRGV